MSNLTPVHVVDLEPLAVTPANAARLLGVSPRKMKGLPVRSVTMGSRQMYPVEELRAFLRDPESYVAEAGGASQ